MAQSFTIQLTGKADGVPIERLMEALAKTLATLRDLDATKSDDGKPGIHWNITKATTNSPLSLTCEPSTLSSRLDNSPLVIRSFLQGMRTIESGKGMPTDFSEDALKETRGLLGLLDKGLGRISFSAPGEESVVPTLRSAAAIDEHLGQRRSYHLDDTTIEGTLETVTIHGGEAFDVFDQLTGTRVRCILPAGQIQSAIEALGKRVAVAGRARFNEKGRPVSIEAESLRILPEKSKLPKASDFEGDGRIDITGGMDSAEFVRRLRDA